MSETRNVFEIAESPSDAAAGAEVDPVASVEPARSAQGGSRPLRGRLRELVADLLPRFRASRVGAVAGVFALAGATAYAVLSGSPSEDEPPAERVAKRSSSERSPRDARRPESERRHGSRPKSNKATTSQGPRKRKNTAPASAAAPEPAPEPKPAQAEPVSPAPEPIPAPEPVAAAPAPAPQPAPAPASGGGGGSTAAPTPVEVAREFGTP